MITITAKKAYGSRVVLDVSQLSFLEGKRYALIGANGSGKSTLLKIIDGQLKAKGEKDFDGKHTVSYMPQTSYAFSLSVKNNILLPTVQNRRSQKSKMTELVKALGLESLLKKNATKLSGGETQRMALARTLMTESDILLLDEPTSAMDVEQARGALELLLKESLTGKTIIFATHSLSQAEYLADEIIFMNNGKVIERGIPSEILRKPKTAEAKAFIAFNSGGRID